MTADGWVNLVAIVVSLIGGSYLVGRKLGALDTKLELVVVRIDSHEEKHKSHERDIRELRAQRA